MNFLSFRWSSASISWFSLVHFRLSWNLPIVRSSLIESLPELSTILLVNLENIYGPYCNADNIYTPDAGVVRYAGTPWTGRCELNLRSCCSPLVSNKTFATRFYIYLMKPPTCLTEVVTIESNSGEKVDRSRLEWPLHGGLESLGRDQLSKSRWVRIFLRCR